MEMNKKGQFGIWGLVTILVLALVIISFLVWNTTFRYVVLGVALAVGGFMVLFKADINKKVKTGLFVGLLGVGLLLVLMSGVLQRTISEGNYVQAPQFGFIRCDPTGSKIPSSVFSFTGEKTVGCSEVGATDSCQLVIKVPSYNWYEANRRITVTDSAGNIKFRERFNDFFGSSQKDKVVPETLLPGTYLNPLYYKITVEYQNILAQWKPDTKTTQYYYNYQPFVIKKYDTFSSTNGQPITSIGKTSCEISYSNKQDIIISDTIGLTGKKGSPTRLEPSEAYTYFTRHITVPSFSTGTDVSGAYCVPTASGGSLYQIEEVKTNEATYKIISPTYSEKIRDVDCCNGESSPGKVCRDNKWVNIDKAQCSITKPCPNDQFQRDVSDPNGMTAIRYKCVSGNCVPETKQVECTLNQQCGAGFICVGFKCVETCVGCNVNNTCGNGVCESWESEATCPKDCDGNKSRCNKWYQVEGTQTDYKYNILFFKFGATEKPICKVNPLINIVAVVVVIIVLGSVAIYSMKPKRRKK